MRHERKLKSIRKYLLLRIPQENLVNAESFRNWAFVVIKAIFILGSKCFHRLIKVPNLEAQESLTEYLYEAHLKIFLEVDCLTFSFYPGIESTS